MTTKLGNFQDQVIETQHDQMGFRVQADFLNFLHE